MSGKKSKKLKNCKVISLQEFMGDQPSVALPKKTSWADSVDDDEDYGVYTPRRQEPIVLPTAPRAARDNSINEESIPTSGPYTAYISNLPYEIEQEDMYMFFEGMSISNVRLPKVAEKFKGYGYVTFDDRTQFIEALNMTDTSLKGRRIRIEMSKNDNDDRRGRMGRMGDQRRDYGDDPERTTGDWRSARSAPADSTEESNDRGRSRYGGRDREDRDRDSGFDEARTSNWRDAPREKMGSERPRPSYNRPGPPEGERDWNRFSDRNRGNRDGSRERNGSSSFGPRRFNEDSDRDKERWGNLRNTPRESTDDAPPSEAPKERPKLALQPRTKPIENAPVENKEEATQKEEDSEESTPRIKPTPVPSVNIFGAAKPVDTAAREREIEERIAKSGEAARLKEESETEKRGPREGAWGRRNGEEPSRPAWRSNEDRGRFDRPGPRPPISRPGDRNDQKESRDYNKGEGRETRRTNESSGSAYKGPSKTIDSRSPPDGAEKERKPTEEEELSRMPKAKDDQAPNFVASNKYSMLPDDFDPDNIEE